MCVVLNIQNDYLRKDNGIKTIFDFYFRKR